MGVTNLEEKTDLEQTLRELEAVMEKQDTQNNPARMLLLQRQYPWGEVCYVHPSEVTSGVLLPGDISQRVTRYIENPEVHPLTNKAGNRLSSQERRIVAAVTGKLMEVPLFSGLADYGMGLLTGDVGENGKRIVDGVEMDVLVVPQGYRRAEITAAQTKDAGMKHPLAANAEGVLEVMALVMGYSELVAPYCRLKMFADGRNQGVIVGDMSAIVTAVTWDFSTKGIVPYLLGRTNKVVMESEKIMFGGSERESMKAIWRYWGRVAEHVDAMKHVDEKKQPMYHDKLFFLENGLGADNVYTNTVYCGKGRNGKVIMAFPKCSPRNYFFQGKTQATLFELLERFGERDEYNVIPMRIRDPQELAAAFGYDAKGKSGRELTNAVLMEKVDLMLAPGTFRGPQWVHGYKPLNEGQKTFATSGQVALAAEAVINLYNNTVWGLHGGVVTPDGSCMAANRMYCTVFAKKDLKEGIVRPLEFRYVEKP